MFSFVMEMEGLDFRATLEASGPQSGVDLDQFKSSKPGVSSELKNRALEVLELAASLYQAQLKANQAAMNTWPKTAVLPKTQS